MLRLVLLVVILITQYLDEARSSFYQPVVGVLTLPENATHAYLPTSYVNWVESSGARVVPLHYTGVSDEQLIKLASQLDGILFTGGNLDLFEEDGKTFTKYAKTGKLLVKLALELDTPLWGTCLGLQLASIVLGEQDTNILEDVASLNVTLPLIFNTEEVKESKMFHDAPRAILDIFGSQSVTVNSHHYSLSSEKVESIPQLKDNLRIIATDFDDNGVEFISVWEHKTKPVYAVQFHPEKNIYEWNVPEEAHTSEGVYAMQYLSRFFISECRNRNAQMSEETLSKNLIQNWQVFYTPKAYFFSQYYFPLPKKAEGRIDEIRERIEERERGGEGGQTKELTQIVLDKYFMN